MSNSKGGNGGIVANIASVAGVAPFPACVVYAATKHGVLGLTRSLGVSNSKSNSAIKPDKNLVNSLFRPTLILRKPALNLSQSARVIQPPRSSINLMDPQ